MMVRFIAALGVLLAVLGVGALSAPQRTVGIDGTPTSDASVGPITFVAVEPLAIVLDAKPGEDLSSQVAVSLRNSSATDITLAFSLVLSNAAGTNVPVPGPAATDTNLPAFSVKSFDLTFKATTADLPLSGVLVASGGAVPTAERPVELSLTAHESAHLALGVIGSAGVAALIALVLASFALPGGVKTIRGRMGPTELGKDSWASTIAGAGGLVAAFGAGSGFLPETTHLMTKGEFAGLALFFAGVPIFAAFAYSALTTTVRSGRTRQEQGFVATFLLAGALTVGAVVGQLLTLTALVADASSQDVAESVSNAFFILLFAAMLISVIYGVTQMRRKISAKKGTRARPKPPRTFELSAAADDRSTSSVPILDSWSLL